MIAVNTSVIKWKDIISLSVNPNNFSPIYRIAFYSILLQNDCKTKESWEPANECGHLVTLLTSVNCKYFT